MAVVPGDTKLCTRKNFNSNVVSYFTNDDKILTRREIDIGSFVVGDYKYTLSSSVTNLNTCMACKNITYTKTENDPTIYFYVNINANYFEPNIVDTNIGYWEYQGSGEYMCTTPLKIEGIDSNGTTIFYEDVDVIYTAQVEGGYDGAILNSANGSFTVSAKKSAPLRTLIVVDMYYPVIGISTGNYYNVTSSSSSNNVNWSLGFEIAGAGAVEGEGEGEEK